MKKLLFRALFIFLTLTIFSLILKEIQSYPVGQNNYFVRHGVGLLIGLTLFPRLTLVFSSIVSGGILWWVSWFFYPRILVAMLATINYFQTNPILVVASWLIALSGELFEKKTVHTSWNLGPRIQIHRWGRARGASSSFGNFSAPPTSQSAHSSEEKVIEAEFREL